MFWLEDAHVFVPNNFVPFKWQIKFYDGSTLTKVSKSLSKNTRSKQVADALVVHSLIQIFLSFPQKNHQNPCIVVSFAEQSEPKSARIKNF